MLAQADAVRERVAQGGCLEDIVDLCAEGLKDAGFIGGDDE